MNGQSLRSDTNVNISEINISIAAIIVRLNFRTQVTKEYVMTYIRSNKLSAVVGTILLAVFASTTVHADQHGSKMKKGDIVDTAIAAGQFNTLAAALEAADLVSTLKGDGPFTVFAPTDEAFAKLPAGTVESLLKPENRDQLVAILTYHVVPGKVSSKEVVTIDKATTVNGSDIAIKVADGKVRINDATVITADVDASNGVIHVIDTVILPN